MYMYMDDQHDMTMIQHGMTMIMFGTAYVVGKFAQKFTAFVKCNT